MQSAKNVSVFWCVLCCVVANPVLQARDDYLNYQNLWRKPTGVKFFVSLFCPYTGPSMILLQCTGKVKHVVDNYRVVHELNEFRFIDMWNMDVGPLIRPPSH